MSLATADEGRIKQFLADFNAIERCLLNLTAPATQNRSSFMALARDYRDRGNQLDLAEMSALANLRNVLVHHTVTPGGYVSVPTEEVVRRTADIRERLTHPELVYPRYRRAVVTLLPETTLATVLDLVWKNSYSQFPVLDGERVVGLVTENGITRCIARHANRAGSLLALGKTSVQEVVRQEEIKDNFLLVRRSASLDQVTCEFKRRLQLEAVLITRMGGAQEPIIGIVTRADLTKQ